MLRKAFILVLILVLSSLAISAQELPDDANACNEGGAMEGKCNVDINGDGEVSEFEVSWAWTCGWYMIRYDAGIFAEVPLFCQSLLPSEPPSEGDGGDEGDGGVTDLCYTGPFPEDPPYYSIFRISTGDFVRNSATDEGLPPCEGA